MKINKKLLAILVLAALPVANSHAGWMRTEGEVAASAGLQFKDNGNFFDRQSISMRNACGSGWAVPMYAEYGVSYYHTVYATSSLENFSCGNGTLQGLTDVETGIRGRLDYFTDHNWEVAAIFPNHLSANGAFTQPKHFGVKAGIHSSVRLDPYQSFLTEQEIEKSVFSYGAGIKHWTGGVPGELWGYVGYGHIITDSDWARELGGWAFAARLDVKKSISNEHTIIPGNGVQDFRDSFSLLTGQIGFTRTLSLTESLNISLEQGLLGRNINYVSGIFVGYSKVMRSQ